MILWLTQTHVDHCCTSLSILLALAVAVGDWRFRGGNGLFFGSTTWLAQLRENYLTLNHVIAPASTVVVAFFIALRIVNRRIRTNHHAVPSSNPLH